MFRYKPHEMNLILDCILNKWYEVNIVLMNITWKLFEPHISPPLTLLRHTYKLSDLLGTLKMLIFWTTCILGANGLVWKLPRIQWVALYILERLVIVLFCRHGIRRPWIHSNYKHKELILDWILDSKSTLRNLAAVQKAEIYSKSQS